jgi:hypothetical protein
MTKTTRLQAPGMRQPWGAIMLLQATFVCGVVMTGQAGQRNGIDKLLNHFPGDHVLTLSERDSDARDFILKHFPRSNPSVVHADFDGDGHPDYAMLPRDNKSGTTKFVVLLRSGITQYKSVYELDVTPVSGEVYIRPLPIGSRVSQTEEIDTKDYPSPVQLSSTGIELTYFEKATVVYYWNKKNKKIEAIQTED